MTHVTHRPPLVTSAPDVRRTAITASLLALVAVAVLAALTISGSSTHIAGPIVSPQPAARSDGGPDESATAASVASRKSTGPSESAIAAAVGSPASDAIATPDESRIAAAIYGPRDELSRGPDESHTAAAIAAP
jgi:hypothetical protein